MALKLPIGTMGTATYGTSVPNYSTASTGRGSYSAASRGGTGGGVSFNSNAYGSVPNPTPIPKSTWEEANAADPNFAVLQQGSDAIIKSQQAGQLSPETIKSLQDNAATFGVTSGMPGSGLQQNRGLRDLGLNVEALQQQGLTNYLNSLKTIGSMQLDPSLVSNINTYNNQLASAPDPAAAAAQEEALWQKHFQQTRGPAGPTGSYGSGPVGPRLNSGPTGSIRAGAGGIIPDGTFAGAGGEFPTDYGSVPVYGYNSSGVWGNMAGQQPWQEPQVTPQAWSPYGNFQGGGGPSAGTYYAGAAPGSDMYDAALDPSSPDYQPGGAE